MSNLDNLDSIIKNAALTESLKGQILAYQSTIELCREQIRICQMQLTELYNNIGGGFCEE